jgi:hypothetical protein
MLRNGWLTLVMCGIAVAACSGDSTGSSGAQVAGTWRLDITNFNSGPVSCLDTGKTMTLQQAGSSFSGSYNGGQLKCSSPSGSDSSVTSGKVVHGSIAGDNVQFDLDTTAWHHTGTISGTTMSGLVNATFVVSGTPVTVAGNWSATKH